MKGDHRHAKRCSSSVGLLINKTGHGVLMGIQAMDVLSLSGLPLRSTSRIAIWARVATTSDFYIAGKTVFILLANGMATAADWMSAASFISMAGMIAFLGYDGSVYLMGWTGGYVLLALLLAPYLQQVRQVHRSRLCR
jgi:Na+(H+)/acetate symporter ActP